jgi:hypothetical protein
MNILDMDIELEHGEDIELEADTVLAGDGLAFDRRSVDVNGRMTVPDCNISRANICPYAGHEIAGSEALGLDPGKVYMLYRDPKALAASASSFEAVPLMMTHVSTTADQPNKPLIAGVVSNVRWKAPHLVGDVCVWSADAINLIESGEQRELSCGYAYRCDMTPGTIDGEHFDGRMLDIRGQHVALVAVGRAGPGVTVRN